jgi:hypothetical protein
VREEWRIGGVEVVEFIHPPALHSSNLKIVLAKEKFT